MSQNNLDAPFLIDPVERFRILTEMIYSTLFLGNPDECILTTRMLYSMLLSSNTPERIRAVQILRFIIRGENLPGHNHVRTLQTIARLERCMASSLLHQIPTGSSEPVPAGYHRRSTSLGKEYPCVTEDCNNSRLCVYLGNNSTVPRWERNGTLAWLLRSDGLSHEPLKLGQIESAMRKAAQNWNVEDIGIQFKQVSTDEEPVFTVVYNKDLTGTYAIAFPPDAPRNRRVIEIGPDSFFDHIVSNLPEILTHELGHVLGFRHEFWPTLPGESRALSIRGLPFRYNSVMNPYLALRGRLDLMQISRLDRYYAWYFYNHDHLLHGSYGIKVYSTRIS